MSGEGCGGYGETKGWEREHGDVEVAGRGRRGQPYLPPNPAPRPSSPDPSHHSNCRSEVDVDVTDLIRFMSHLSKVVQGTDSGTECARPSEMSVLVRWCVLVGVAAFSGRSTAANDGTTVTPWKQGEAYTPFTLDNVTPLIS